MKIFNRIQYRLLAVILVVVLVPLIGTSLYGNWFTSGILREQALSQARNDTNQAVSQIDHLLSDVGKDVLFLSELSSLQSLMQARSEGDQASAYHWRQIVENDFITFSRQRGIYDQIRYINKDGMEIIRVDSDGIQVTPIPKEELQDKSGRYYFSQAVNLAKGATLISPLDLNRERSGIETPHQPVIRYATPIVDQDGERHGVVIVNVLANKLLDIVQDMNKRRHSPVFLVDQDGYYLVHPDTTREWGGPNDLDSGFRLQQDYPEAQASILTGEPGELVTERALVYSPVHPNPDDPSYYWTLVYDGSLATLFLPVWQFRYTAFFILILATVIAAVMAFWLAQNFTEPIRSLREGVEQLRKGGLDEPVEVSTNDEIGDLAHAFNDMAYQLDISQRQRQQLLDRVISAQEDERQLVAYDIHDGLIQRLVGARLHLSNYIRTRDKIAYGSEPQDSDGLFQVSENQVLRHRNAPKAERSLQRSSEHLGAAIAEGRQLIEGLRPTVLDDLGLVAAVRKLTTQMCDMGECQLLQFASNCDGEQFSPNVEMTAFRIAQEALSNVRRHAQTPKLRVEIMRSDNTLNLLFQDWGIGFDIESKRGWCECIGLVSMRERANLVDGQWEIDSRPGNGTTIRVTLPLDEFSTSSLDTRDSSENDPQSTP